MTALTLNQEFGVMRLRFKRTLGISVGLHILLFGWLIMNHHVAPLEAPVVEITWLEQEIPPIVQPVPQPEMVVPVVPEVKPVVPEVKPLPLEKAPEQLVVPVERKPVAAWTEPESKPEVVSAKSAEPVKSIDSVESVESALAGKPFTAESNVVPVVPELTVKEKLARDSSQVDLVRKKLSALKPSSVVDKAVAALPSQPTDLVVAAQTSVAQINRNDTPAELNRGLGADRKPVPLTRGSNSPTRTNTLMTALPKQSQLPSATAIGPESGSTAVRNLGDATLSGLVADRPVLVHPMPDYPVWATNQAVEATVTLYFLVMSDGRVKENVQVKKTAGFQDFDSNAVKAISQWRFEPLTGEQAHDQWGTITFRYRLND